MSGAVECDMRAVYICTPTVAKRPNARSSRCVVELKVDRLRNFYLIATSATQTHAEKFRYNITENAVQVNRPFRQEESSPEDAKERGSISIRFDSATVVNIFLENPRDNDSLKKLFSDIECIASDDKESQRRLLDSVGGIDESH